MQALRHAVVHSFCGERASAALACDVLYRQSNRFVDTYLSLILANVNSINWQPKALRQLRKIEARAGKQIRVAVSTELVDLNAARNVKSMTNHEYGYRLRVGNYRVFFDYDGEVRIVSIEEVRKRNERTY